MKKKISILLGLFLITIASVNAQGYVSLYNLGDYVIQTQNISPVYLPKNSFSIGVGSRINFNNSFAANDFLVENSAGKLEYDFNTLLDKSEEKNSLSTNQNINLFMMGFKTKKGSITLFANARSATNWQFSKSFVNIAANGITDFNFTNDRIQNMSYGELGIGLTRTFFKEKLALAVRFKKLYGLAYGATKENAQLSLDIDDNTSEWTINASNATILTSGIDNPEGENKYFGDNSGFGYDFGATYAITDKLTLEVAVNDVGKINWKENIRNYNITDVKDAKFSGVDLDSDGDIGKEIEDALNDIIGTNESTEEFSSKLITKTYVSAKYQLTQKNAFTAVYFTNPVFDESKAVYGLGYNRTLNKTTYGVVASAGGFDDQFKLGANMVLKLGPIQLYAAANNITALTGKTEELKNFSINFGLNLVFGYNKWIAAN